MKTKQMIQVIYVLCTLTFLCSHVTYAKTKVPRTTPGTAIFVMAEIHQIPLSKPSKTT